MKVLFKFVPSLFLLAALLSNTPSFAADKKQPDPNNNSVLATITKSGAKLYYIGTQNGLDGWFIIKDGQVQIAYATQDGKGAVVGLLFANNGDNITNDQVKKLVESNPEIATLFKGQLGNNASSVPGATAGDAVPLPGVPTAAAPTPAAPATVVPPAVPAAAPATASLGDQLIQDLQSISGVTVGNAGPQLLMVMDPDCPHCQKVWKELRDPVTKGRLQVRLIPIGLDATGERSAAQLLAVPGPLQAWDKYVAGDKSQLAGTPDALQLAAVRANRVVTQKWKISMTPYLVYRDKEGKVKIVQGELEKPSAVLGDLGL